MRHLCPAGSTTPGNWHPPWCGFHGMVFVWLCLPIREKKQVRNMVNLNTQQRSFLKQRCAHIMPTLQWAWKMWKCYQENKIQDTDDTSLTAANPLFTWMDIVVIIIIIIIIIMKTNHQQPSTTSRSTINNFQKPTCSTRCNKLTNDEFTTSSPSELRISSNDKGFAGAKFRAFSKDPSSPASPLVTAGRKLLISGMFFLKKMVISGAKMFGKMYMFNIVLILSKIV